MKEQRIQTILENIDKEIIDDDDRNDENINKSISEDIPIVAAEYYLDESERNKFEIIHSNGFSSNDDILENMMSNSDDINDNKSDVKKSDDSNFHCVIDSDLKNNTSGVLNNSNKIIDSNTIDDLNTINNCDDSYYIDGNRNNENEKDSVNDNENYHVSDYEKDNLRDDEIIDEIYQSTNTVIYPNNDNCDDNDDDHHDDDRQIKQNNLLSNILHDNESQNLIQNLQLTENINIADLNLIDTKCKTENNNFCSIPQNNIKLNKFNKISSILTDANNIIDIYDDNDKNESTNLIDNRIGNNQCDTYKFDQLSHSQILAEQQEKVDKMKFEKGYNGNDTDENLNLKIFQINQKQEKLSKEVQKEYEIEYQNEELQKKLKHQQLREAVDLEMIRYVSIYKNLFSFIS